MPTDPMRTWTDCQPIPTSGIWSLAVTSLPRTCGRSLVGSSGRERPGPSGFTWRRWRSGLAASLSEGFVYVFKGLTGAEWRPEECRRRFVLHRAERVPFAAVGTVSAVIVALWQTSQNTRRDRRSVHMRMAGVLAAEPPPRVMARITNESFRPVRLDFPPYLVAEHPDGTRIALGVAPIPEQSSALPQTINDGETLVFVWDAWQVRDESIRNGAVQPLFAHGHDALDNHFECPYLGVRRAVPIAVSQSVVAVLETVVARTMGSITVVTVTTWDTGPRMPAEPDESNVRAFSSHYRFCLREVAGAHDRIGDEAMGRSEGSAVTLRAEMRRQNGGLIGSKVGPGCGKRRDPPGGVAEAASRNDCSGNPGHQRSRPPKRPPRRQGGDPRRSKRRHTRSRHKVSAGIALVTHQVVRISL